MTSKAIEQAVAYLQQGGNRPNSSALVNALLLAEKESKKTKQDYSYAQLIGAWRLGFVSGTQTVRSRPNAKPVKRPGKGRFLPSLTKIEITYTDANTVENAVSLGPLQLRLTGPTCFWPNTNSLAFDFTHLNTSIGPLTLYDGAIRGGAERNQAFKAQSLRDQAFFTFFLVEEDYIAARGKGGGLALWTSSTST
ncbi:MAG: hypothetical protein WA885_06475 [Phormidesmis sp.]